MKSFKTFLFCALLLFFAIQTASSVCAQTKFSGNYNLNLYGVSRWKTDYILIKKISSKTVEGTLGLDWNILQEARLPANFEKMHEVPFKGVIKENCVEFKVRVADRKEYSFTLFLMEYQSKPALTGYVEIKSLTSADPAPPIKTGVFAIMK